MTDLQAAQIRELRVQGAGYRSIASVVGLSRDIVRNYCKSHGLDGYATALTVNMKERMHNGYACQFCGKELQQPLTGRKRKFCSEKCRRDWWKVHSDQIQRKPTAYYESTCVYCGKLFTAYGNNSRKYCSHACYVSDRFGEKLEAENEHNGMENFIG